MSDRQISLDLKVENTGINLFNRLKHKKQCDTGTNRVFNRLSRNIAIAKDLISSGKLHSEDECFMIQNLGDLKRYKERIFEKGDYVLDMETTGLDIFNDIIVGMCIYVEGLPSAYIPINHTDIYNNRLEEQLSEQEVIDCFREVFESEDVAHILHNAKYDYKVILWNWGIKIKRLWFDTLIGSFLLNENEAHGLKPLYNKYILEGGGDDLDFVDYFGDTPFNYIPLDVAKIYGANDGIKTYKLYQFQRKYLTKTHKREDFRKLAEVMFNIEMPLIPLLADIELRGVEIRVDYANSLRDKMRKELDEVKVILDKDVEEVWDDIEKNSELIRLIGDSKKINYASPSQLKIFFYDVLKLKSGDRKNPKGTGEKQLNLLIEKYKIPFIQNLLQFRGINKLLTTYVEKLPNVIEPKTGAVHTQFNALGAATGRFSSSDPISKLNLQNIPSHNKDIRKIFKAREGKYFIGGDYSQIEPRVTASMSNDEMMVGAYRENKDLYSIMASNVYGLPVDECKEFREDGSLNPEGKERRTAMKSVLLGILYGRGSNSVAEQIGKSLVETEKIIDNFFNTFPSIREFQQKVIYNAEKTGYVSTLFGRKRRLEDMKMPRESYEYQRAYRQTINAIIQGTAGDVMKLAMIEIWQNKRAREIELNMIMTIHDELICEIPKENVVEGKELLEKLMKSVGEKAIGLPMKTDIEVTEVWYGKNIEV